MRHPALQLIADTKDRAAELRSELEAAERAHHEAIMTAVATPETDAEGIATGEALFTISQIADAAGVSRARIYKRINRPVYGDRSVAATA
jgi:hypothetical protein